METNYYSLEVNKSNKLTRIFQLVFGIVCAVIAIIWLVMNLDTLRSKGTLIITILFLLGFAYYLIISGLGKGEKYVVISKTSLKLKRNSVLSPLEIPASAIEKIEIFPLSIVFFLKPGKREILRFGTTFTDIIEPVKKSITTFCSANNIILEYKNEEM